MAKNGNGTGLRAAKQRYQSADEIAEVVTPNAMVRADMRTMDRSAQDKKRAMGGEPPNKLKVGLTDLGATVFAQGFNEGWAWLMRVAGTASVDGWVAQQNDMLQASVPTIGGLIWYLVELYGLGKAPPSAFKMGRTEASKLLFNLGLSKFWQALRSRSSESKKALEEAKQKIQSALADNTTLKENVERLQAQLADIQKQAKQQNGGGGK